MSMICRIPAHTPARNLAACCRNAQFARALSRVCGALASSRRTASRSADSRPYRRGKRRTSSQDAVCSYRSPPPRTRAPSHPSAGRGMAVCQLVSGLASWEGDDHGQARTPAPRSRTAANAGKSADTDAAGQWRMGRSHGAGRHGPVGPVSPGTQNRWSKTAMPARMTSLATSRGPPAVIARTGDALRRMPLVRGCAQG